MVNFQEENNFKDLQYLESAINVTATGNTFCISTTNAENLHKQILKLSID